MTDYTSAAIVDDFCSNIEERLACKNRILAECDNIQLSAWQVKSYEVTEMVANEYACSDYGRRILKNNIACWQNSDLESAIETCGRVYLAAAESGDLTCDIQHTWDMCRMDKIQQFCSDGAADFFNDVRLSVRWVDDSLGCFDY